MTPVEEVLRTWREAERVLDDLPPFDPDRASVGLAIVRLKDCYQQLTDRDGYAAEAVESANRQLDDAHALLSRVKVREAAFEPQRDELPIG